MDLKYVPPVTRRKVTDIPVKYLVIKDVEKIAADDKIMTLKFETKSGGGIASQWDYENEN